MPIGFVANALGVACVILNPLRTGGTDVNSTPSARHGGDTTSRRWRGLRIDAILRARLAFAWAANRRNRYAVAGTVCIDRDTRRCSTQNAQFRRFLEYWGDQSTSGALLRVVTPECPDTSTSSNDRWVKWLKSGFAASRLLGSGSRHRSPPRRGSLLFRRTCRSSCRRSACRTTGRARP